MADESVDRALDAQDGLADPPPPPQLQLLQRLQERDAAGDGEDVEVHPLRDAYAARLAALDALVLDLEMRYLRIRMLDLLLELAFGGGGELGGAAGAAPAAAVAGLEKRAFRAAAAATGCAVCLEDFEDGEEVSAMPCARGHEFHPTCIAKWLGRSNTCPLCRHALPTSD